MVGDAGNRAVSEQHPAEVGEQARDWCTSAARQLLGGAAAAAGQVADMTGPHGEESAAT
jgi:hypothetical protein